MHITDNVVLICDVCGSLVGLKGALRASRKRSASGVGRGDGCQSATCVGADGRFRAAEFLPRQARWIDEVDRGTRPLVEWPNTGRGEDLWICDDTTLTRAVARARMQWGAMHGVARPPRTGEADVGGAEGPALPSGHCSYSSGAALSRVSDRGTRGTRAGTRVRAGAGRWGTVGLATAGPHGGQVRATRLDRVSTGTQTSSLAATDRAPPGGRCVDWALSMAAGLPGLTTDAGSLFRLLRSRVCIGSSGRLPLEGGIPAVLIPAYAAALALRVSVVRHRADGSLDWFADSAGESDGDGAAQHRWAILMSDGLEHCVLVGVVLACNVEDALRVWLPARPGLFRTTACSGGVAEAWPAGARVGGGPGEGTSSGPGGAPGTRWVQSPKAKGVPAAMVAR